jgi:hypothetical protein
MACISGFGQPAQGLRQRPRHRKRLSLRPLVKLQTIRGKSQIVGKSRNIRFRVSHGSALLVRAMVVFVA